MRPGVAGWTALTVGGFFLSSLLSLGQPGPPLTRIMIALLSILGPWVLQALGLCRSAACAMEWAALSATGEVVALSLICALPSWRDQVIHLDWLGRYWPIDPSFESLWCYLGIGVLVGLGQAVWLRRTRISHVKWVAILAGSYCSGWVVARALTLALAHFRVGSALPYVIAGIAAECVIGLLFGVIGGRTLMAAASRAPV